MNNRILVVDDNTAIHGDFEKILRPRVESSTALDDAASQLFKVTPVKRQTPQIELSFASSGEESLRMVEEQVRREEPFAMAFMDVQMPPGWDGVQTVLRLWEADPELLIVFCTAYSDYSWPDLAEMLGQTDKFLILKKPFEAIEATQLAVAMLQKWSASRNAGIRMSELDHLVAERTLHLQRQVAATLATEERFSKTFHLTPLPMLILQADNLATVDANAPLLRLASEQANRDERGFSSIGKLLELNPAFTTSIAERKPLRGVQCELSLPTGCRRILIVSREFFTIGKTPHMLILAEDITDRLAGEEQLRQSQKMEAVGQLAAGIAHDFNNIMTVILGRISDHVADPDLPPSYRDSLTEVLSSGSRAAELTRQLLAFGRRQALSIQSMDIAQTLRSQVAMLERVISENYRISLECEPLLPAMLADPSAVHHIVMNLIINARDAMPLGGPIEVSVRAVTIPAGKKVFADGVGSAGGQFICLGIRDEGCGMDEGVREHIFEPFFTTKEVGKGSGLGLPMVYGLVAQLSGWLEVDSKPGGGSEFRVYLPTAETIAPVQAPVRVGTSGIPCGKGRTALIVEDDAPIRRMLCQMVGRFGFEVLSAASGQEALLLWENNRLADRVDLVITDIVMPGSLSGLGLGARLQEESPDVKIVYSTGYSAEMVNAGEFLLEKSNYLPKPYELTVLSALLAQLFPSADESASTRGGLAQGDLVLASS